MAGCVTRYAARAKSSFGTGQTLRALGTIPEEATMTEKKGRGSDTAKKANAKASHEGKSNPRTSSSAQAELGKKGGKSK
ncbi:hypothetical protein ABID82_001674 [Methylobacterium sp. PvP062]|uniref:Uncharacterized protein n=2 Tax=Methylobacterium TaxID=407 RepID=A0A509E9Y3_9HYPH|nr:hypothetical protein ME121_0029 [Methylobacterium sp. ME121]VUD70938.1 hypothetical protein MET9862_01512 [Methylobacterium symbioticum]